MASFTKTIVRPVVEADRRQLANLLHFEAYVHRHLDWRAPLEWMGSSPFLVSEQGGKLRAALACPQDPPGVAWIRLFTVSSNWSPEKAWRELWPAAITELKQTPEIQIAAIPLHHWFKEVLAKNDFHLVNQVVLLQWDSVSPIPAIKNVPQLVLRPINFDDLPIVTEIDNQAFEPLWQISQESLEYAFRQSSVSTLAEMDGYPVGYQISTGNPLGGHLARLAVRQQNQKQGIGSALLFDLLNQFKRRGAVRVTVNTQQTNHASLSLYHRIGFIETSEVFPVYKLQKS
jgi:ribosomal protein S18 acetylase RimI-like enzyme